MNMPWVRVTGSMPWGYKVVSNSFRQIYATYILRFHSTVACRVKMNGDSLLRSDVCFKNYSKHQLPTLLLYIPPNRYSFRRSVYRLG